MTTALRSDAGGSLSAIQVNGVDQLLLNASGLLQAAQSGGTAPQFDASLALVTTAFLKRFGMQGSGVSLVTATSALAAAVAGGTVLLGATVATTQTLPPLSSFPINGRIEFMNAGTGIATIAQNAADTTGFVVNGGTRPATMALGPGDTLTLAKVDVSGTGIYCWAAVGGSSQLGSSASCGLLKATNGYQKLLSGLILQWGVSGTQVSPGGGNVILTLPIAFPNAIVRVLAFYDMGASNSQCSFNANTPSLSQIQIYNTHPTNGATPSFLALGW